jgi:hypothetical protein
MGFVCPECLQDTLEIEQSLDLPADGIWDGITLQFVTCDRCGFAGAAVYCESRRGELTDESWRHDGYYIPVGALRAWRVAWAHCPTPADPHCRCPVHQVLGQRAADGRWLRPVELDEAVPFPMRLSQR